MVKAKKILFVTQEMVPYVPGSPMADFGRKVSETTQSRSREIRTFMPKWGIINERRNQLHEVIRLSGMNLIIDDTDHPLIIKVVSITSAHMQVYFIDNDDYFSKRRMTYDEQEMEYADNAERAVFYARGVLETVKKLRWVPEVIHCQGWMSSIIPLYIKTSYAEEPSFRDCRVVYTPSDVPLQTMLPENFPGVLHFRNADISCMEGLPNTTSMNALDLLGVKYADGVSMLKSDAELEKFALSLEKPYLSPQEPEIYATAYPTFYDTVWSVGKEEKEEEE